MTEDQFSRCFSPRPVAAGRGPLFMLQPGQSPEQQTKDCQQRQDNEASHAADSFTLSGVYAVSTHWEHAA